MRSAKEVTEFIFADEHRKRCFQEWWDENWSWDGLKEDVRNYWESKKLPLTNFAERDWTPLHLPPCDRNGSVCSLYNAVNYQDLLGRLQQLTPEMFLFIEPRFQTNEDGKQHPKARFDGCIIREFEIKNTPDLILCAQFDSALFVEITDFSNFKMSSKFRQARFVGGFAVFQASIFTGGSADFGHAEFPGGSADFALAHFAGGGAIFEAARFNGGPAYFNAARFSGGLAHFSGAKFVKGRAVFDAAQFSHNVDFSSCYFSESATFRSNKGEKFPDRVDFSHVVFCGDADFSGRSFQQATDFRGAEFRGAPLFYDSDLFQETYFERGNFESNILAKPWLQLTARAVKSDRGWLETTRERKARKASGAPSGGGPVGRWLETKAGRRLVRRYRKSVWRNAPFALSWPTMRIFRDEANSEARRFEVSYRVLRRLSLKAGNPDDESMFHGLELDARRTRSDVATFERAVSAIYKLTSDYGRSLTRPLLWFIALAGLIILFGTPRVMDAAAVNSPQATLDNKYVPMPDYLEVATYLLRNFIPPPAPWFGAQAPTWANRLDAPTRSAMTVLSVLQSLIFIALGALFLIALRRRFQMKSE